MGRKKMPRAETKLENREKRVAIDEANKEPTSAPKTNASKPGEPLKSALKKSLKLPSENDSDVKQAQPTKQKSLTLPSKNESKVEEENSTKESGMEEKDIVFLEGFEQEGSVADSSDEDSSDDDQGDGFNESSAFHSKDLPTPKPAHKAQNDKSSKLQKAEAKSGVIYLGRIPHGFYEEEMKGYFDQFGEVNRLRLSRCKKTGKPKHYGFIEFKHHQVAQIVAETLNNYLLCGNLLQCKLVDQEQIHPKLWVGAGSKFRKDIKTRLRREKRNQPKSLKQQEVIANRLIEREKKKRKRLAELGIDYDFPGYVKDDEPKKKVQVDKKPGIFKKRSKKSISS